MAGEQCGRVFDLHTDAGSGGGYLAFITGNLINMKIPCAVNARDMVGAKTGTPENEIISTISIATSSLVTILVLAVGVL